MKHRFILIITTIVLLLYKNASAQIIISGYVTDKNRNPIAGASISLKGTYEGKLTNDSGFFSFTTKATGQYYLTASAIGFLPFEKLLDLNNKPISENILLREEITELKAVVINAGTFEASDKKKATILKPLDIVTTAGADGDINNAIRSLPGVQQVGESGELFVRGGTGSESKIFIDGMVVNNPNLSGVPDIGATQRNRFSAFLFKGVTFSSGGYSALYGNAMSAALIMESNDLPARSESSVSLTTTGIGGSYQQLSKSKKTSYGINADYTNLNPTFSVLKQQNIRFTHAPESITTELNSRIKTSKSGMLKFYTYAAYNKTIAEKDHIAVPGSTEYFAIDNKNIYSNVSFKTGLGNRWNIYAGGSAAFNNDAIINDSLSNGVSFDKTPVNVKASLLQGKLIVTKSFSGLSAIRFGGEYLYSKDSYRVSTYFTDQFNDSYFSSFAEADIYFTANLAAKVGTRIEHSQLLNKYNIAPRISLAYKLPGKTQVSFAYGDFYQKPESQYLSQNRQLSFSKATHFILNYQYMAEKQTFRIEAYLKKYSDLITTAPSLANEGEGYAKGIELFWRDKKTFKNTDYWVAYSYTDAQRKFLNYPLQVQPNFVALHTASLVVKHMLTKLKTNIGASYAYASGRPYFNPNLSRANFMSERAIDFHSLSLNLNYLTTIKKAFVVFVVSVTNVMGNRQVFGYNYLNYKINGEYLRREITPSAKRFVFAGAFINIGVDRRQNTINNF
jgi:hypothetical protein